MRKIPFAGIELTPQRVRGLRGTFKLPGRPILYVESMVKRFDVKKATKIPAASGVPTLSKADEPRNPEEKEYVRKFPYREAVGALM